MTVKEIRKAIREKKKEIYSTQNKVALSNDIKQVRSLGETLEKLKDELNELEEKLDEENENGDSVNDENNEKDEEMQASANAEKRNFDVVRGMYGNIKSKSGVTGNNADTRSLASFSFGGNSTNIGVNHLNGLALRRNESFVSRLGSANKKKLDLGKYIRGAITGDWNGADAERRSMTTSTGGVVIPQVLSAEVLDTARNISFFTDAGCPVVPLVNGNMVIARVSSDPSFKFYDEMSEATESSMELEGVELKAKTARGFCLKFHES